MGIHISFYFLFYIYYFMVLEVYDLEDNQLPINKIIHGDAKQVLKKLPSESVDLIITSPPYWGLRWYGNYAEQIGLEDHPQKYIDKIVEIVEEGMRVLKKTGVFYLNIGDTYYTRSNPGAYDRINNQFNEVIDHRTYIREKYKSNWLQRKQKLLIPHRIAIALQDKGYIIRDDIVWVKKLSIYPDRESIGCCVPSSTKDRLTTATEYIFQIVKSQKYKFYPERIGMKLKDTTVQRYMYPIKGKGPYEKHHFDEERKKFLLEKGILPSFWSVKLKNELSYARSTNAIMFRRVGNKKGKYHFATFPETLVEFFILASSDKGDIVLDPFAGSGTTLKVAKKLGRNYIGIEINYEYCEKMEKELKDIEKPFTP